MFDWENAIALHAMHGIRASSRGVLGLLHWQEGSLPLEPTITSLKILYPNHNVLENFISAETLSVGILKRQREYKI